MSLEAALSIAITEGELGVKAHYFVLLRTEMYNLFSEKSLEILNKIIDLGHNIGLHFDASLYADSEINDAACWEADCLQNAIKQEINMISFHRPAQKWLGHSGKIAGRSHTYQPQWFNEMAYCSDSRGRWDFGHPLDLKATEEKRSLQLLTHPIWWCSASQYTVEAKLKNFLEIRQLNLQKQLALNCEPYREAFNRKKQIDACVNENTFIPQTESFMQNPTYILGIHDGHNCGASLSSHVTEKSLRQYQKNA